MTQRAHPRPVLGRVCGTKVLLPACHAARPATSGPPPSIAWSPSSSVARLLSFSTVVHPIALAGLCPGGWDCAHCVHCAAQSSDMAATRPNRLPHARVCARWLSNALHGADLSGYDVCDGMERNPNRFSEKDCRMACCYDPNCMVWQAFPIAYGRQCYHGYKDAQVTCTKPANKTQMGGGLRKHSPLPAFRTDYSFATATADASIDTNWPVVDAPHDFLAEFANFTNDPENFKQGYLPRNASWYRKHFNLPEVWLADGGITYLHFEGIFHHATVFLNGKYLQSHECGYTGFTVRLDNATGIKFGTGASHENVLAIRTDASFGSGHWYEGYVASYRVVRCARRTCVCVCMCVCVCVGGFIVSRLALLPACVPHEAHTLMYILRFSHGMHVVCTQGRYLSASALGTHGLAPHCSQRFLRPAGK